MDYKSSGEQAQASTSNWERDQFTKNIEIIFQSCQKLIISKNSDYTKINQADPFHNFRQETVNMFLSNAGIADKIDGITLGLVTRLNDKRRRRENLLFTSGSLVLDETIEDTIKDEINYLAILLCHLRIHGSHLLKHDEKIKEDVKHEQTYLDKQLIEAREDIQRLYHECEVYKESMAECYRKMDVLIERHKQEDKEKEVKLVVLLKEHKEEIKKLKANKK